MDQYERLRSLGNGAYGVAWLVQQKHNDRHGQQQVLKEIDLTRVPDTAKREAHEEANVLRSLSHINIIAYYFAFMESSKLCIVMEFADGGDLAAAVRQRRTEGCKFCENDALAIMMQCCLALQHVHAMHILHRDLKCQNIFLTKDHIVKLGDFGIARVLDCTCAEVNTVIGTPSYLPPEVVDNKPYGITADIWSLGIVFYELLVLEPPFQANCLAALVVKIATAEPQPIPANLYSEELRHVVMVCLQKTPETRPKTKILLAMKPFSTSYDLLPLAVQKHTFACGGSRESPQMLEAPGSKSMAVASAPRNETSRHRKPSRRAFSDAQAEKALTFRDIGTPDLNGTLDARFLFPKRGSKSKEEQRLNREKEIEEARLATRSLQKDMQAKYRASSRTSGDSTQARHRALSRTSGDSTPKTPINLRYCEGKDELTLIQSRQCDRNPGHFNSTRRGLEPSRIGLVGGMVAAQHMPIDTNAQFGQARSNDEKFTSRMHRTLDMTATLRGSQLFACMVDCPDPKPEKSHSTPEIQQPHLEGSLALSLQECLLNELVTESTPPEHVEQAIWSDLTRNPYDCGNCSPLELSSESWQQATLGPEQFGNTLAYSMSLGGDLSTLKGPQAAF